MGGISAITRVTAGLASAQLSTEIQVATLACAQDAIELQGQAVIKLTESAVIDPDVGQQLDVTV